MKASQTVFLQGTHKFGAVVMELSVERTVPQLMAVILGPQSELSFGFGYDFPAVVINNKSNNKTTPK